MPLPELLRAFERDTADAVREILAAGEADAARIDAEAARERRERITSAAAATAAEHRARADAAIAAGLHAARAEILAARAAMLARLRAAAVADLAPRLDLDPALARALADAALACCGDEPATFTCAPAAARHLHAGARVDAEVTGVVAELASGTRIDATLHVVLDREWDRLAAEIAR